MEAYRLVVDIFTGAAPSSHLWMVIITTVTLLLVGTSGTFITRLWRTQFKFLRNLIFTLTTFLFSLLLWLLVILLAIPLAPIWLPTLLLRHVEATVCKKLFGWERLNTDAITWMMDSPENPSIITGFMILEEEFSIERLREVTKKKWLQAVDKIGRVKYPNIKRYIGSGFFHYYWCDEEQFDLSQHVYEWDNNVYTKEQLPDLINTIIKSPFNIHNKRSPWEQILVHFKDADVSKSCLVVRTSHAMADGTAIINFFVNHVADEPAVLLRPPDLSSSLKMFMKIKGWFNLPMIFLQSMSVPVPSHDLHNVHLDGTKNITWSRPISLQLIKSIKNKLHVTVNDVLLGCLATKLHHFFKDAGKTPPKEFTAGVPFNTRFTMEEADQLRNKFAVVLVRIPTEGSDVVKNIKELRNQMNALKTSAQNHGLRLGMRLMNYALPLFIVRHLHGLFVARLSMVLSNVPGPQLPFKFDGTAVESMSFVPPARNNIGVSLSLLSYSERVFITACCDNALCATSGDLMEGFPELFVSVAKQLGVEDAALTD